jgi:fructose-bisphosphate aldolase class I
MSHDNLDATAQALVAPGKGILAADESTGTIGRRLASIQVDSTEQNRRAYRELLFTTQGAEQFISGVILFDETIRQRADDGTAFPEVLARQGIIPGIKVDKGTVALAGFPGEKITEGLDGLAARLAEYVELGARFTKWRAVITIGADLPSDGCIAANAEALARFAALSQEAGLVPIVEPEVLMDGDHTIARCREVTVATLVAVFEALRRHRVRLEGMLLKPNMVVAGSECPEQAGVDEVAAETLGCLRETVPAAVPGIVFLSGGQSDELATAHLNAMNRLGGQPWQLSFSFGRALQAPVLEAWKGEPGNGPAAQRAFAHRARLNGAARLGEYRPEMEHSA